MQTPVSPHAAAGDLQNPQKEIVLEKMGKELNLKEKRESQRVFIVFVTQLFSPFTFLMLNASRMKEPKQCKY